MGLFLLGSGSKQGVITVKDVNDDVYKNAEVGVHVKNKKVKYKAKFIDNEPVLTIQIAVKNNSIREIHNEDINENNYVANKNYLSVCLKEKLKEKISSSVDKVIENSMAYADIFGLESKFKMQHPKQYKKYKELFGDDFIKQIKINYDVKIGDKE